MNTRNLLYSGQNRLSEINDSDWYEGNVLYIRPSCRDCDNKVKINNHIDYEGTIELVPGLTDFEYDNHGGTAQINDGVITFQHNGTTGQIVTFPQT